MASPCSYSDCISILESCKQLCVPFESQVNESSKSLILHKRQWHCLAKCFSVVLDTLDRQLQAICRQNGEGEIRNWPFATLLVPLQALYHAMQEAERCMADCTKPSMDGGSASLSPHEGTSSLDSSNHAWRVCKALSLGVSTVVVDLHLHDFMWAYATVQLVLCQEQPLMQDCEKMLTEELRLLQKIWKIADKASSDEEHKLLRDILMSDHDVDDEEQVSAAEFVYQRVAQAENMEQYSTMACGQEKLPAFLWVDTQKVDDSPNCIIGRSSYGIVYEAKFHRVGKFAVKMSPFVESFGVEAAIQARLRHPNVVHLVCCLQISPEANLGCDQLLMGRLKQDLHSLIKQRSAGGCKNDQPGPFTLLEALDIMLQIAKGMEYLHSLNIIHRDLKSFNILVGSLHDIDDDDALFMACSPKFCSAFHVKVADFGTAKAKPYGSALFSTTSIGTSLWRAPEMSQLDSREKYTIKADVYSFAMVCYEILTGQLPFAEHIDSLQKLHVRVRRGERPSLPHPQYCPPSLKALIASCWDADPSARPCFSRICRALRFLKACVLLNAQGHYDELSGPYSLSRCLSSLTICSGVESSLPTSYLLDQHRGSTGLPSPLFIPLEMYCCSKALQASDIYSDPPTLQSADQIMARHYYREEIVAITGNFENVIEGCGARMMFCGTLADGTEVVVRPSPKEELKVGCNYEAIGAELEAMSKLRHKNIVPLLGWCVNGPQLLVMYKRMANGDLESNLYCAKNPASELMLFERRYTIIQQLASALAFLHSKGHHKPIILHRDVKTSNVMLDSEWNARLGGFNFARVFQNAGDLRHHHLMGGHGHDDNVVQGTRGFMAPEINFTPMTPACDVFSFGVVVLNVACGKPVTMKSKARKPTRTMFLLDSVWKLYVQNRLMDAADNRLQLLVPTSDHRQQFTNQRQRMQRLLLLGLSCTNAIAHKRPLMDDVVAILAERQDPPTPHRQRHLMMSGYSQLGCFSKCFGGVPNSHDLHPFD